MKRYILILILPLLLFVVACDKDEFADINSDPSTLSDPELRYSVTKAIEKMYNDDYTIWFYDNFDYIFPWTQLTTEGTGNTSTDMMKMGAAGGQNLYKELFPNTRDIRARIDAMSAEEKDKRKALKAITYATQIQPAITVTDKYGALVYNEAAMAPYTTPPLLTPKYDNQETLFNTWLSELDMAIKDLNSPNQIKMGNQDLIYNGDYAKWAKFCNLLKLKIASRLINVDKARAIKIAEEVATSSAGYMNSLDEDFVYNRGSKYYGPGSSNQTQPGAGGKNIIDFLVKNKDPRVRFIFTKNRFNAEVVQAFIDAEKELPPYVKQYVKFNSKGGFESWKAPGEPWIRYFGVPVSPEATLDSKNDIYFNQSVLNKIVLNKIEKSYRSTSNYSEFITRTEINFSYPTKPGGRVIEQKDNYPGIHILLGSSAETNLLLAEFKLLGANLPKSAQEYFNTGVKLSVERFDLIAKNNKTPYYETDPVYLDKDVAQKAATKLKAGEVDALLKMPAYNLDSDGLEKVYIQQYVNYAISPNGDIWTLVRRSGMPKSNSKYLAAESFSATGEELTIPRRFVVHTPTEDNKNYQNQVSSHTEQGFTSGTNDPKTLNTERIWFDKNSPNYGKGN